MGLKLAPYGTWESPITTEAITKGANGIADVLVDEVTSEVYHLERRPSESGRTVLVHSSSDIDVIGREWDVRTSVQEYGGCAAVVHGGMAYFSHSVDGRVYSVPTTGGYEPQAVTPAGKPYRYACMVPHPNISHLLVSVLEDHTHDVPSEIITTIVVIDTKAKTIHPLVSGADFYALPAFSPDGKKLLWVQWLHPDMPWDGSEIHVADVVVHENMLSVRNAVRIAGEPCKITANYPAWANNDTIIFTSDESGFVNPWKYKDGKASTLFSEPVKQDFGHSFVSLSAFPFAILDTEGTRALFYSTKNGQDQLYLVDLNGGALPEEIASPYVALENVHTVSRNKHRAVFVGFRTDEKESLVQCSFLSLTKPAVDFNALKSISSVQLPMDIISQPQPISLMTPKGYIIHNVYYPPWNPAYYGSSIEGEKPPCVVSVHGGPTSISTQGLSWAKQYYTSRGWAWLDVNYRGSSGFGREYVEKLNGNWGIVDVNDCIDAPAALSTAPYNFIDPKRIVIRGGSAGGFTVLAAVSIASNLKFFAAATSLFGVSDLKKFVETTHKFESHYLDHLLGGTPETVPDVYEARSAVYHAEKIVIPLQLQQGEIDKVVPKDQAESIYESVLKRGGDVEFKLYPGEGHGWRKEETLRDSLERELAFYKRVLKLE